VGHTFCAPCFSESPRAGDGIYWLVHRWLRVASIICPGPNLPPGRGILIADDDADIGRFTALDPLGAKGGEKDWYGYCVDDPVHRVDAWGLEGQERVFLRWLA